MELFVTGPYDEATQTMVVEELEVLQIAADKDFIDASGVRQLTSITFLIDLPNECGGPNTAARTTVWIRPRCLHLACVQLHVKSLGTTFITGLLPTRPDHT